MTLGETIVSFGLLGLLLLLALGFLVSMFKSYGQASVRHQLQTSGILLSERLVKELRTTGEPGLTLYQDEDRSAFYLIPLETVTTTGQQVWDDHGVLYYWTRANQTLSTSETLPTGVDLGFAPDSPPRPTPEQFLSLMDQPGRLLSEHVTLFEIVKTESLLTLDLGLEQSVSGGPTERYSVRRELSFKS